MTYTLGLDIGAASIGWAMTTDNEISRLGSRIFPEGIERSSSGKESPRNAARRKKRLLRRQIARKAQRRETLLRAFQILGWLPTEKSDLEKIWLEDPYALRKKALDEPLQKSDLARVFFHLSKHRGFKSNRKTDTGEETLVAEETPETGEKGNSKQPKKNLLRDGDDDKQGYGELDRLIKNGTARSVGEYLASLNPHEVRIRSRYALRTHYEEEFEKICDAQRAFHAELDAPVPEKLLAELCSRKQQAAWKKKEKQSLRAFIKSYLIFFQRPLKSQKHTVDNCSLEPKSRRAPLSSLTFQTFRIWDKLATIELLKPERRFLTPDEKARAAHLLERAKEMELGKLLDKISLTFQGENNAQSESLFNDAPKPIDAKTVVCNYDLDKKLKGNDTAVQLMTMFRETSGKATKKEQEAIEAKWNALSEAEKEQRWKIIYDATDNDLLKQYGKQKWTLTDAGAEALTKIQFKQGYGSLSGRAMKKLIPLLKQGLNYPEACAAAGYHHSDKRPTQLLNKLDKAPNLRNPIVQQGLFELRRLVNALIKTYGKPDAIHIEFARELKMPKQKREDLTKENEARRKANERAADEIRKLGYPNPTGDDIRKYNLWRECNGVCPYTGKQISAEMLFRNDAIDIEHILPYSRTQDDSFNNLTLCFADFNRDKKKNLSPFEMKDLAVISEAEYEQMLDRVETFGNRAKLRRFTQQEIKTDDFVSRQLNDTAYLAREAKAYLETVCPKIVVSNGQATAKLRKLWGLNSLLHPLKEKKRNEASREELEALAEKNRSDNRHHALDAAVIAATTTRFVQMLSSYSKYKRDATADKFPLPFTAFREQLKDELDDLLVSRYQKDRVQGALHEDTFYGAVREQDGSHREDGKYKIYTIRKPVSALTGSMIEEIADKEIRLAFESLIDRLKANGVAFKESAKLPKEFFEAAKKIKMPIKRVTIEKSRVSAKTLTPRDIPNIEPPFIRAFFEKRLQAFPDLPPNQSLPDAFFENFGVPIKHVRIHKPSSTIRAIREGKQNQMFIETGNNHHIEIFREIESKKGKTKYVGRIVTLIDAAKRKREKRPVVDKTMDGHEFVMSLMIDEMVLMSEGDFNVKDVNWEKPDYKTLSQHLYRVQKMSANQIFFCHHLESTIANSISKTPNTLRGIKVKVDVLGNIKPVSEPLV
jgi:CRISPR-associated endonuclease Csn1